jgi:hypothetical protein
VEDHVARGDVLVLALDLIHVPLHGFPVRPVKGLVLIAHGMHKSSSRPSNGCALLSSEKVTEND